MRTNTYWVTLIAVLFLAGILTGIVSRSGDTTENQDAAESGEKQSDSANALIAEGAVPEYTFIDDESVGWVVDHIEGEAHEVGDSLSNVMSVIQCYVYGYDITMYVQAHCTFDLKDNITCPGGVLPCVPQ